MLALRPRFNAIAQSERDAAADVETAELPGGDDFDTARSMATLFTEAGEAHAIAISTGASVLSCHCHCFLWSAGPSRVAIPTGAGGHLQQPCLDDLKYTRSRTEQMRPAGQLTD